MATINIHIFIIVKYNDFDYLNKRYRMDGSRNKNPETTLGREIGRQTGDLHLSPCSSKYNSTVSFRGPQNASFLLPHAPPPYSFPMDLSDLPHLSSFSWLFALCHPHLQQALSGSTLATLGWELHMLTADLHLSVFLKSIVMLISKAEHLLRPPFPHCTHFPWNTDFSSKHHSLNLLLCLIPQLKQALPGTHSFLGTT